MVSGVLCTSSGTDVVPVDDTDEELVVRYSTFDKVDLKDHHEDASKTDSKTSHLKDELGILRLSDRQRVTFHLKRRTNQKSKKGEPEIQISKHQSPDITKQEEDPEQSCQRSDVEKNITLLRNRVVRLVKKMQKDHEKGSSSDKKKRKSTRSSRARPHTVVTSRPQKDDRQNLHAEGNRDVKLTTFRDGVTPAEAHELKSVLEGILHKKMKKENISKQGSIKSNESKAVAVQGSANASVSSPERQTRRHRRSSTRSTKVSEDAKVKVLFDRDSHRPKLLLHAVGRSSRDSTADWIMKQNFEEFKYANEEGYISDGKDSF